MCWPRVHRASASKRSSSAEPRATYHETARAITLEQTKAPAGKGNVCVVCAGTSDLPVAEEAAVTARLMGNQTELIADVGVAGIHRLLAQKQSLQSARVLIVCAGMEGALPTVVAGLVNAPVLAVPTSVGYGASFGGVAALLGMLNTCSPNVSRGKYRQRVRRGVHCFADQSHGCEPGKTHWLSAVHSCSTTPLRSHL